jgi:uncharacterized membrane protein
MEPIIMHIIEIVSALAIIVGIWAYARRRAQAKADAAALAADDAEAAAANKPAVTPLAAGGRRK